jgi:hypothetical protein
MADQLRRFPLSVGEARALAQAQGGAQVSPTWGAVLASWLASTPDPQNLQPGVDMEDPLRRLIRLTPLGDFALRDAIARWWANPSREASAEGFAAVGLSILDQPE